MSVGGQRHAPAALPPGEGPGTPEAGWAPRPVWTDAENLTPTGIRSPDPYYMIIIIIIIIIQNLDVHCCVDPGL